MGLSKNPSSHRSNHRRRFLSAVGVEPAKRQPKLKTPLFSAVLFSTSPAMKIGQQVVTIALLLFLLLSVISPFSALASLMLILVGLLIYALLTALVKAFVSAEVSEDS